MKKETKIENKELKVSVFNSLNGELLGVKYLKADTIKAKAINFSPKMINSFVSELAESNGLGSDDCHFTSEFVGSDDKQKYTDLVKAKALLGTMRGHYIIGQALRVAYREMDKDEEHRKEYSNMKDMKLLGENLFDVGWVSELMNESMDEKKIQELINQQKSK
jgi:hypothetical protein